MRKLGSQDFPFNRKNKNNLENVEVNVLISLYLPTWAEVIFGFLGCDDLSFRVSIGLLQFGASFNFNTKNNNKKLCVLLVPLLTTLCYPFLSLCL